MSALLARVLDPVLWRFVLVGCANTLIGATRRVLEMLALGAVCRLGFWQGLQQRLSARNIQLAGQNGNYPNGT